MRPGLRTHTSLVTGRYYNCFVSETLNLKEVIKVIQDKLLSGDTSIVFEVAEDGKLYIHTDNEKLDKTVFYTNAYGTLSGY